MLFRYNPDYEPANIVRVEGVKLACIAVPADNDILPLDIERIWQLFKEGPQVYAVQIYKDEDIRNLFDIRTYERVTLEINGRQEVSWYAA